MYRRLLLCHALAVGLSLLAAPPLWGQTPDPPSDEVSTRNAAFPAARVGVEGAISRASARAAKQATPPVVYNFPSDPEKRLARAESAFRDGEYPILSPLLKPTLIPTNQFERSDLAGQARILLAVGLYFEAQQVTGASQRKELLDAASLQFLELLRDDPFYNLNPMIYPASVVELFATVEAEHSAELDALRAELREDSAPDAQGLQTVYIEREVDRFSYAVNFLPFGLGQIQNDQPVQGTLFASAQVLALALNVGSYWRVEDLRSDIDGKYEAGRGNSAEQARNWQTMQYVGLAAFVGLYAWSVIDALVAYEPYKVRIRTLDAPPPELSSGPQGAPDPELKIGWNGIGFAW